LASPATFVASASIICAGSIPNNWIIMPERLYKCTHNANVTGYIYIIILHIK
jgi:hypothetical protein